MQAMFFLHWIFFVFLSLFSSLFSFFFFYYFLLIFLVAFLRHFFSFIFFCSLLCTHNKYKIKTGGRLENCIGVVRSLRWDPWRQTVKWEKTGSSILYILLCTNEEVKLVIRSRGALPQWESQCLGGRRYWVGNYDFCPSKHIIPGNDLSLLGWV